MEESMKPMRGSFWSPQTVLPRLAFLGAFVAFIWLLRDYQETAKWLEFLVRHRRDGLLPAARTTHFNNTHLILRLTHHRPERRPLRSLYSPYFASTTVSMPGLTEAEENGIVTIDGYHDSDLTYGGIGRQLHALRSKGKVGGVLQNHFDLWFVPNQFEKNDLTVPWIIKSQAEMPPMTTPVKEAATLRPGWFYQEKEGAHHLRASRAQQQIQKDHGDRFHFNVNCIASNWADFYYIPASHFDDFAVLSQYFEAEKVQHETAVASIMLIMISTRAAAVDKSGTLTKHLDECPTFDAFERLKLVEQIGDCWGSCCTKLRPTSKDIASTRCGHPMNLRSEPLLGAFMRRV